MIQANNIRNQKQFLHFNLRFRATFKKTVRHII